MGFVPKITCRNCRKQYSGLRGQCPYCGTRRARETGRVPITTASVTPGTAAASRAAVNNKWQLIFGAILLAAVILAVIVLVSVSLKDGGPSKPKPTPPAATSTPVPTPTPTPTPTPSPTPGVTGIAITYGGEIKTEFSAHIGSETPLSATTYPLDVVATVEWSSSDESICTVSDRGVVTALASGWCTIYASCGDVRAECRVLVW